jgi:hypothetical protein
MAILVPCVSRIGRWVFRRRRLVAALRWGALLLPVAAALGGHR